MATSFPSTVFELGPQGCMYLWALLTAQARRLPIAPTRRFSQVILANLQSRSVIEVDWPATPVGFCPDVHVTPLEGFKWRLIWPTYEPDRLLEALEDYFDQLEPDDFVTAARLKLWIDLASAESERFYEAQLVKHRFAPDWAQDMAFAYRDRPGLSMAEWRYCAWAAVRRGASMALQEGAGAQGLRETMYRELQRRAATVASGAWAGCAFPPQHWLPGNALGQGFARTVTRLEAMYWAARPAVEPLLVTAHPVAGD